MTRTPRARMTGSRGVPNRSRNAFEKDTQQVFTARGELW
jgi:hypothetical protein